MRRVYLLGHMLPGVTGIDHQAGQAKAMVSMQMSDEDGGDGLSWDAAASHLAACTLPCINYNCLLRSPQGNA